MTTKLADVDLTKLTRESLPFQFCSDHLKAQILELIERIERLEQYLEEAKKL